MRGGPGEYPCVACGRPMDRSAPHRVVGMAGLDVVHPEDAREGLLCLPIDDGCATSFGREWTRPATPGALTPPLP